MMYHGMGWDAMGKAKVSEGLGEGLGESRCGGGLSTGRKI
jgi:hypothetical protein